MPLLPLYAFMACSRVNLIFHFFIYTWSEVLGISLVAGYVRI